MNAARELVTVQQYEKLYVEETWMTCMNIAVINTRGSVSLRTKEEHFYIASFVIVEGFAVHFHIWNMGQNLQETIVSEINL